MEHTTCCIVGGGPAGMVLGLLLARSGVDVTVLEKHDDFLRDFRGDTVHPTTMNLIDDLGLSERFDALPQRRIDRMQLPIAPDGELFTVGDLSTLNSPRNYVALVPQWDFLNLLADTGEQEPTFTLRMNTEAVSLIHESGRVRGVRYRDSNGTTGELHATITVACDGRNSFARTLPDLGLHEYPCPIDAWWFRIPRRAEDPAGLVGNFNGCLFSVLIDRGDYWQCAAIIPKGSDARLRSGGLDEFLATFTGGSTWLRGREDSVTSWDEVKLLDVRLNRLRKWHVPGLLCLGDAAHAMSPIGGIGINLAVQDAVAAARYLGRPLRQGTLGLRDVERLQQRRATTTTVVQGAQRLLHAQVVGPLVRGEIDRDDRTKPLLPYRLVSRLPQLRKIPAYILGYGAMQERPPREAIR